MTGSSSQIKLLGNGRAIIAMAGSPNINYPLLDYVWNTFVNLKFIE